MSRQRDRQRFVCYIRPDNYIYALTKITPPDGSKPPHGAMSDFMDALIDSQRNKEALSEQPKEQKP